MNLAVWKSLELVFWNGVSNFTTSEFCADLLWDVFCLMVETFLESFLRCQVDLSWL